MDAPVSSTTHAEDRWVQRRARYSPLSVETVWTFAEERPDIAEAEPNVQRARYHESTDVVLLALWDYVDREWAIVTVLRGADASNPTVRDAVQEEVDHA